MDKNLLKGAIISSPTPQNKRSGALTVASASRGKKSEWWGQQVKFPKEGHWELERGSRTLPDLGRHACTCSMRTRRQGKPRIHIYLRTHTAQPHALSWRSVVGASGTREVRLQRHRLFLRLRPTVRILLLAFFHK